MAKKKSAKLKARLPRGFVDRGPAELQAMEQMLSVIKQTYELYGFEPVETPMFEYTDALGKFLPDQDRPNAGVFSLQDDDEQWMSLRYDLTAPLARHVAENINSIQLPFRSYRSGYVFRNEKPGPGRFRQFMQFDADTIGAPSVSADAEMCMMMADTMENLGVPRGQYLIRVNNRKILDGIMDVIGLSGDENADRRLITLRAIDKLDKFGKDGVRDLLGAGRKDISGDFTSGAQLTSQQIDILFVAIDPDLFRYYSAEEARKLNLPGAGDGLYMSAIQKDNAQFSYLLGTNETFQEGYKELSDMASLFNRSGYKSDRIKLDASIVRGLEYYTGPVYEAELQFNVTNSKGQVVQFGSVGGGGRYDGLVKRFTGRDVPATGFSIGVSRLLSALLNLQKVGQNNIAGPVVVCVMDKDIDSLAHYQAMVQELRTAGIRSEMYQGNPKQFGKQLQYADKRNSPCAIIQGSQEREEGEIQIKDLIEGKRLSAEIEDNKTWRESRPAQFAVKRDDLVAEVKKLLAAQEDDRKNQSEN